MKYREGGSETSIKGKGLVGAINTDTRFGVFSDAFLKEVCFALKTDIIVSIHSNGFPVLK
jgi:hypothetical protein